MKKSAFFFLVSLISFSAISQNAYFYVSGIVINQENNQPMQGASVFAENTTIGTTTNAEGKFSLQLPAGGYDLIVSFTGYGTERRRITSSDAENRNLSFSIKPKEKEMEAVAVISSAEVKNGWEKYGGFFIENFIGKSENSAACNIKNPEKLHFFFYRKKNKLKITSEEPIMVENRALGYLIHYALDSFTYAYETQTAFYTGNPLFEELVPSDDVQRQTWVNNREKAYRGSILHYMRSLFQKRIVEEGFQTQYILNYQGRDTALPFKNIYGSLNYQKDDSLQVVSINPAQRRLVILYLNEKPEQGFLADNPGERSDFEYSVLTLQPGEPIYVEQNGFYYDQADITMSEYWGWSKVADQLPYNYTALLF
jgi:hypothetical protein